MLHVVFGDPQIAIHAILAAGYFCELTNLVVAHWPKEWIGWKSVLTGIRGWRWRHFLAILGACTIAAGYTLMCLEKSNGLIEKAAGM